MRYERIPLEGRCFLSFFIVEAQSNMNKFSFIFISISRLPTTTTTKATKESQQQQSQHKKFHTRCSGVFFI